MADNGKGRAGGLLLVEHFMTYNPELLHVNSTLADAVLLLRRAEFKHIPVLDGDRLVGILSDRDVARFAPSILTPMPGREFNRVLAQTELGRVMAANPHWTTPTTTLRDAAEVMRLHGVGCLPVMEDERVVGIITVTDMLEALCSVLGTPTVPPPQTATKKPAKRARKVAARG
ncbi:MAG: CBS domain-containing protein [Deltaproteobacteria bacterium]|nr:CBS domain-containing protein [Deltaproteobacteria bacterium]